MKSRRCADGVDLGPICEMYRLARMVARERCRSRAYSRKPAPELCIGTRICVEAGFENWTGGSSTEPPMGVAVQGASWDV